MLFILIGFFILLAFVILGTSKYQHYLLVILVFIFSLEPRIPFSHFQSGQRADIRPSDLIILLKLGLLKKYT